MISRFLFILLQRNRHRKLIKAQFLTDGSFQTKSTISDSSLYQKEILVTDRAFYFKL